MSKTIGTSGFASDRIVLVRDEFVQDPQQLPKRTTEWQGIETKLREYAAGLKCQVQFAPVRGNIWSLTAFREGGAAYQNGNEFDEVFSDKWELKTEPLDQDIFSKPIVQAAANKYHLGAQKYRKQCGDFVGGTDPDSSIDPNVFQDETVLDAPYEAKTVRDIAFMVVAELARGADKYENEYLTLRRTRSIAMGFPTPMPIYTVRLVYDTNQLPVPKDVLFSIPDLSTMETPIQSKWGWRLRHQQSEFLKPGRIDQSFEWVLAAWSTFLYESSTDPFPP